MLSWLTPQNKGENVLNWLKTVLNEKQIKFIREDVIELKELTREQVEQLFQVQVFLFKHDESEQMMWRAEQHYRYCKDICFNFLFFF